MTRILAMGDLHLRASSRYEREPGDGLRDQAALLQVIAQTAVEHDVDVIANLGDTFDGPTVSPAEEQVFADFIATCRDEGIPVLTLLGNGVHDLAQKPVTALEIFRHVPGVEIFTEPAVRMVGDTAVCMLPWTPVSRLVAKRGGGDRDDNYLLGAELLIQVARELREQVSSPCVLALHFAVEGAALPNGLPVEEKAREPILPLAELEALGFDCIIGAHIHRPQALAGKHPLHDYEPHITVGAASILYTGSPMALSFGEERTPHGVWIVDLGGPLATQFVPIESRRFLTLDADFGNDAEALALRGALPFDAEVVDDAIVRLRYRATEEQARRIDHAAITAALHDAGAYKVFILPEIVRADRARVDGVTEDLEPLAAVDAWVSANDISTEQSAALVELTVTYLEGIAA